MAMNMMDMIMQAAGGNTAQQAGSQLGLSPQQSQQAIGALLPAISSAMKRNTSSPEGLAGLLGALQNGQLSTVPAAEALRAVKTRLSGGG